MGPQYQGMGAPGITSKTTCNFRNNFNATKTDMGARINFVTATENMKQLTSQRVDSKQTEEAFHQEGTFNNGNVIKNMKLPSI